MYYSIGMEDILRKAVEAGVPIVLWGEPGIGKTARIEALASDAGYALYSIVLSHYDPVELHGVMIADPRTGRTRRATPDWVSPEVFQDDFRAILFFDELSTSTPAQQAAALRIFSDRQLGGRRLGNEVRLIAAANPPDCAAGGAELAPPMANRWAHIYVRPDMEDFSSNFPSLWGRETAGDEASQARQRARTMIVGFLRRRPELLHRMPQDPAEASGPWPSPRSWELCSRLIAGESSSDRILAAAAATVGHAAAAELASWLRDADIPDPEDVLREPETAHIPERGDVLYAAIGSVIQAALARPSAARVRAVWRYLARVAGEGHADVCAPYIRRLISEGARHFSPTSEPALIAPFRRVVEAAR